MHNYINNVRREKGSSGNISTKSSHQDIIILHAPVAQWIEYFPAKEGVAGSIPVWRILWRGVRAVEGARLESVYTGNRIESSNLSPSASLPAGNPNFKYQIYNNLKFEI